MARFGLDRRSHGALLGVAVFLAVMAFVAAIFLIARNERAFEFDRWQARLKAGSTGSMRVVNEWLSESRAGLRAVAVNPTVQIYLSEMATANGAPVPDADTQLTFLSGYVASLGKRGPFATSGTASSDTGLAVLDAKRHLVAFTTGYRPSPQLVAELLAALKRGLAGPLPAGGRLVAFGAAIMPIQGAGRPAGYVIGERRFSGTLWSLGGSALSVDNGYESLLAIGSAGTVRLISTSASAWRLNLALSSAEAQAARHPYKLQRGKGMSGKTALALGVPVSNTGWALVEAVPSANALAGVDARIRNLVLILLLSLLAIILGVLALWRHLLAQQQIAVRETSARIYRGAARLLLEAIDQRDPGAAEHSLRVANLSRRIAEKLKSENSDVVELAGSLMNVGKLFVPTELLTKRGTLERSESLLFEEGNARWLALLSATSFELPVEPILRDAYRIGKGGVGGTHPIRCDAYIIAVANIAVALMSVRAYRLAHSPDETIKIIRQSGIPVPQPVLDALGDVIDE
jgi:HD domain